MPTPYVTDFLEKIINFFQKGIDFIKSARYNV